MVGSVIERVTLTAAARVVNQVFTRLAAGGAINDVELRLRGGLLDDMVRRTYRHNVGADPDRIVLSPGKAALVFELRAALDSDGPYPVIMRRSRRVRIVDPQGPAAK